MKLLTGEPLYKQAVKLGIDTTGERIYASSSGRYKRADDSELQRRVIEAERSIRENRLWLIALISGIASILSAIASIIAVSK